MSTNRFGPMDFLGAGLPLCLGTSIVVLRLSIGLGFSQGVSCGLSLAGIAAVLAFVIPGRRSPGTKFPRWSISEAGTVVFSLLTLAFLRTSAADGSLFWPHAFGVDQAHHGALVTAISDSGSLSSQDPRLGSMSGYPPGAHLVSAAAARIVGITPLAAMWFVAMATVAMQLLTVVWLGRRCSRQGSWFAGLAAGLLWVAGWRMSLSMVTVAFWFAQSVSVTLTLGGVAAACLATENGAKWRWLIAALVCGVASQLTYPQSTPIIPLAMLGAVSALAPPIRQLPRFLLSMSKRRAGVAAGAVLLVGVQLAVVRRLPYFSLAAFSGNGEGIVTPVTVSAFGGAMAVAAMAWGVFELFVLAWNRSSPARAVLSAALGPVGLVLVLLLIRWSGTPVTQYRIAKNWFSLFPFLAIAGGVACGIAVESFRDTAHRLRPVRRDTRWKKLVAGSVICVLYVSVFLANPRMRSTDQPLISRDMYVLGRSVAQGYPVEEIGIAGDALGPYTAWWTSLRRLPPGDLTSQLIPRASRYDQWPTGDAPERFLLVDESLASDYEHRPGVKVIARRGGAVFLQRTP